MESSLTQDSQEGRSHHQSRMITDTQEFPGPDATECLLPHRMTYSTTSQTPRLCQQRSLRLSSPSCPFRRQLQSRGLGACAGLLASCPCVLFHSFTDNSPWHSTLWVRSSSPRSERCTASTRVAGSGCGLEGK